MLLPVTSSSSWAAFIPLRAVPMAENSFTSEPSVHEVRAGGGGRRHTGGRVERNAGRLGGLAQPGQRLLDGAGAARQQVAVDAGHGVQFLGGEQEGGPVAFE